MQPPGAPGGQPAPIPKHPFGSAHGGGNGASRLQLPVAVAAVILAGVAVYASYSYVNQPVQTMPPIKAGTRNRLVEGPRYGPETQNKSGRRKGSRAQDEASKRESAGGDDSKKGEAAEKKSDDAEKKGSDAEK
jgi:hypothetical protein